MSCKGVQKIAYKHIFNCGFPNDLQAHVSKHIHQLISSFCDREATFDLRDTCKALRSMRKHEAMQVIKTWCNSWATSRRLHLETLLPCILGCPQGIDDLSHYIACPHIWNIANTAFPRLGLHSALDRLCIGSSCTASLRVLAATFQAYHASKPFSAVRHTAVFDAARRRFESHFYAAVYSSGLRPAAPAD